MKFTQEQLLEALKAMLTKNGQELAMSERTLKSNTERLYKRLEKNNCEDELEVVSSEYFPDFDEINKNVRKEKSDFVKEWKESHPKNTDENQNIDNETIALLKKRLETLEAENSKTRTENLITQKRSELLSKFKEKGIKNDKWVDKYLAKLSISENTDVEKETADALDFYNLSRSRSISTTPGAARREDEEDNDNKTWDALRRLRHIDTKDNK